MIRVLHLNLTRVREPDYGLWLGWFPVFGLLFCLCRTIFETVTVIAGFDDVAMVGQAVEQRDGHLGVAEDLGPFTEGEIGGDNQAGALVEFAQQMEQQGAAGLRERQIAEFIENDQVDLHEPVGDLARLAVSFLLFQRVDELDSGEAAYSEAMVSDGLHADGGGEMVLPVPGPPIITMLWASAMKSHRCRELSSASSAVLSLKWKPQRSR